MNYGAHAVRGFNYKVGVFGQFDVEVAFIEAVVYDVDGIAQSVYLGIVIRLMLLHPCAIAGFPLFQRLLEGAHFSAPKHVDTLPGRECWGCWTGIGTTAEVSAKAVAVVDLDCIAGGRWLFVEQAQATERDIYGDHVLTLLVALEVGTPLAQVRADDGSRGDWIAIEHDAQAAFRAIVEAVA